MATKKTQAEYRPGMLEQTGICVTAGFSAVTRMFVVLDKTTQLVENEVDNLHDKQRVRLQRVRAQLEMEAEQLGLPKPKF